MESHRVVLVVTVALGLAAVSGVGAYGATFVVANANDSGAGSLRQAIIDANANLGADDITFHPTLGGSTIDVYSPLPALTDSGTTVDGDIDDDGTPDIMLDGSSMPSLSSASGLRILSGGNTIRGLAIASFPRNGIAIDGADANCVEACYVGTDLAGAPFGNGFAFDHTGGISLTDASYNIVTGNVVCAQTALTTAVGIYVGPGSESNTVTSNWIGTNQYGDAGLGNDGDGLKVHDAMSDPAYPNLVEWNVLSGNTRTGVYVQNCSEVDILNNEVVCNASVGVLIGSRSHDIDIIGNWLGTNQAGDAGLGNTLDGLKIHNSSNIAVAGNVLSGNGRWGVFVQGYGEGEEASNNEISDNVISGNAGAGVCIIQQSYGVTVTGCSMYDNDGLGIDLVGGDEDAYGVTANDEGDIDSGPNDLLNFPEFTAWYSSGLNVAMEGWAPPESTVEIFTAAPDPSGFGEGQTYLASATAGPDGAFHIEVLPIDDPFTATATDEAGNTSEFSEVIDVSIRAMLDAIIVELQSILDDSAGRPLADKVEDALANAVTALEELNMMPPDAEAAMDCIEAAVGDVGSGLHRGHRGRSGSSGAGGIPELMGQLVEAARLLAVSAIDQAIVCGGEPDEIAAAVAALADGDKLCQRVQYEDAVATYKAAVRKADSALEGGLDWTQVGTL